MKRCICLLFLLFVQVLFAQEKDCELTVSIAPQSFMMKCAPKPAEEFIRALGKDYMLVSEHIDKMSLNGRFSLHNGKIVVGEWEDGTVSKLTFSVKKSDVTYPCTASAELKSCDTLNDTYNALFTITVKGPATIVYQYGVSTKIVGKNKIGITGSSSLSRNQSLIVLCSENYTDRKGNQSANHGEK